MIANVVIFAFGASCLMGGLLAVAELPGLLLGLGAILILLALK